MATTLNELKKKLQLVNSIEAAQRTKENCYAENENGITAFKLIASPLTELDLDASAQALRYLYLSGNTSLERVTFKIPLPELRILYLEDCALTSLDIPVGCSALELISVARNKLTTLNINDECLKLGNIDVGDNQLIDLLPFLPFLKREIAISYNTNPLVSPPKEIVEKGDEAVVSYLESLIEAETNQLEFVPLNEIKIILVGEGMAGKTSLLKQIKGLDFNKNESQTHGVIIEKLPLDALKLFKNFTILRGVTGRFWDFGGQEIMHASHQFFLSNRSIYILVLDSRTDAKKEEWLKHIEKFGGNSPAIIAINKIDENPNYDIERRTLNTKFDFIGNRFHRISCDKGTGLESFAKELADLIPETEIFKTPFNPSWLAVKEQLESETAAKKYIDQQRFEAICVENGVTDKTAQNTLLSYLDSLGIALHFEELQLKNFYVLDPHWVTIGVYKIINSQAIEKGLFKENMLDYILNKEEVKKEEYDPAKDKKITYSVPEQDYLIKIMQEFELLYEYKKGQYLVPDLLPKELQASFSIDHTESDHIHFVMTYDFLPPSVMSRFIIRMKNDIHNLDHLWRYGVELKNNKTKAIAIVKADKSEKRIDICVSGDAKSKRDYFAVIYHALQEINDSFTIKGSNDKSKSLIIKEFMPVPEQHNELVSYTHLKNLEKAKEDKLLHGDPIKEYSVSKDFLDKISTKEERQKGHMEGFNRFEKELDTRLKPNVEPPRIDKLKILFLGANPFQTGLLNLKGEYGEIAKRLEGEDNKDKLNLKSEFSATLKDFQEKISTFKPNIVHFAGHGTDKEGEVEGFLRGIGRANWKTDCGLIFFDTDHRDALNISADTLDYNFETFIMLDKIPIDIVIFNACYSVSQAEVIAKRVKYVVGVNNSIADGASIDFTAGFYFKLAENNQDVQAAFRYGKGRAMPKLTDRNHIVLFIDGKISNH